MKGITVRDILKITKGRLIGTVEEDVREALLSAEVTDVSTDSRKVKPGSLFIAIIGEVNDAHKFIPQVAQITDFMLVEEDADLILAKSDADILPKNKAYIRVT